MRCFNLLVPVMVVAACVAALGQTPTYNLGRAPSAEEIRAMGLIVGPEGKELQPGSGTAKQGAPIYAQKCAVCHGATGAEGQSLPGAANLWPYSSVRQRLVPPLQGGKGTYNIPYPGRTIGIWWPYATTVWDYINRAMPPKGEGTLSADEVYALTALMLYWNDVIKEDDGMDAKTLPKVQMPNRNGFILPPWPEGKAPSGARSPTP